MKKFFAYLLAVFSAVALHQTIMYLATPSIFPEPEFVVGIEGLTLRKNYTPFFSNLSVLTVIYSGVSLLPVVGVIFGLRNVVKNSVWRAILAGGVVGAIFAIAWLFLPNMAAGPQSRELSLGLFVPAGLAGGLVFGWITRPDSKL